MRCLMCGAEMILMKMVKDETMMVSGFEHHTYMCSVCNDIERRFVFNKHSREPATEAALTLQGTLHGTSANKHGREPATETALTLQGTLDGTAAAQGFLKRALTKVRGK
jgi:hypothetical protein